MNTIMNTRVIYINEADMQRLHPLIEGMRNSRDLRALQTELKEARAVAPADVPPYAITMNSKARSHALDTGEEKIFTVVFPAHASIEHYRISVVAPIGTAMLGHRVGNEFEWQVPAGPVRLRLEEMLYQPETAGHHRL